VALRAVVADGGYTEGWIEAERGEVPAAGKVLEAGDLCTLHELGASIAVVGEITDLTRALTPEKPAAAAAVPAVQWTVAVKRVESLRWLLDVSGQELNNGMGHGEGAAVGAVVALRWSLPGDSPIQVWKFR
jgi:hypothetical protein